MGRMGVGTVITVLLLFIATVNAATGGVSFWRKKFTMTCPNEGDWSENGKQIGETKQSTLEMEYDNSRKGPFICTYDDSQQYLFYVQGKVCENCFELDVMLFAAAIVADIAGTMVLLVVIYWCAKNKSSAGPNMASKGPAPSAGRGPPVPSPDYEQLGARNQDPYSRLGSG